MVFIYKSPIGVMKIHLDSNQRYALVIGDTVYGHFHSPESAADDVSRFVTGCYEWDQLETKMMHDVPTDLSEWQCFVKIS